METIRPGVLLHIGMRDLTSYFALCQASERLAAGTSCFGVEGNNGAISDAVRKENAAYAGFSAIEGHLEDVSIPDDAQIDFLVIQDPLDLTLAAQVSRLVMPRLSDRAVILICDAEKVGTDALDAVLGGQGKRTALFTRASNLPDCVLVLWGRDQPERLHALVRQQPGMPGLMAADTVFTALGSGLIAAKARDDLQQENGNLQIELAQAQEDLSARQQLLEHMQAEYHERIEDIVALTAHFRAQLDDASGQARARDAEASALQQQMQDLTQRLDEVSRHRDSLLNSSSWKITGPIRAVMRAFRGY